MGDVFRPRTVTHRYRDAALRALWLSRGAAHDAAGWGDWNAILEAARRERLLALSWMHGGAVIRELAAPGVVTSWRAEVLRDLDRGEAQRSLLGQLLERLHAAGIAAVVLKGAPLAQRLYGDPSARPSMDIDLYIPAEARDMARTQIEALGWACVNGGGPWEESFHRTSGGHHQLLEVHSWLLDDPVLVHLRLPPPESALVRVEALDCPAQSGDLLPGCLAAHLAKHDHAPLLWVNDFSTLWKSFDENQREAAYRAAVTHRLGGYLDWAVGRARLLERAAAGDSKGLEGLGYGVRGRREGHSLIRLARLAADPSDAASVFMGRAWPPHLRGDGRSLVRQAAERLAGRLRRAAMDGRRIAAPREGMRPAPAPGAETRALDVGRAEFGALLQDLMQAGVATWVRARGESMEPTIPDGSLVHIVPLPPREFEPGEVVLARMPNGSFAVHRVLHETGAGVAMQGDNVPRPDPIISRDAVLGLADQVSAGGRVRPIPTLPSPFRRHASGFVRRVKRRLRRVIGGRHRLAASARARRA